MLRTHGRRLAIFLVLSLGAMALGCGQKETTRRKAERGIAEFTTNAEKRQHGRGRENGRHNKEPLVHVDGVPKMALSYLELPPSLPTRWHTLTSGKLVRRFRLAELVTALGFDLAKLKEIHVYGGRDRLSILEGSEIRKLQDEILFSFTQSIRGKPRMHYPDHNLRVNTRVDLVDDIVMYVERQPPKLEGKYATLTFEDGVPIEGIPYAGGDRPGGTRVYVDGVLRTFVKRRSLANLAVANVAAADDSASPEYLLRSYVTSLGIDWTRVKGLEVLGRSDVLVHFDAGALTEQSNISFSLPKGSRGLVRVDHSGCVEPAQAITVYVETTPPDRASLAQAPTKSRNPQEK